MKDLDPAAALAIGAVVGLLIGVPLGRRLDRAAYTWEAARYAVAAAGAHTGAVVGWGLAALGVVGGAVWWFLGG